MFITKVPTLCWMAPLDCIEQTRDILLALQQERDDLEPTIQVLSQLINEITEYQHSDVYTQDLIKLCQE